MISLLSRLDRSVSIEAELDIELNKVAFHLSVADNSAILSIDRWKDALSLAKNFATDSSNLSVDVEVRLPLYGTASNFRIRDTLPFSYDDLDNVE